jgi:DnaJ-domain-containing protein 1
MAMVQHNSESVVHSRIWRVSSWLDGLGHLFLGRSQGDGRHVSEAVHVDVQHTIFSYTLAALACKLMRVDDGEIHPRERAVFIALFTQDGVATSRMRALMAAAAKDAAPMQQYARQLLAFCAGLPQRKRDVLERLVRVAMADGSVNEKEFEFLCELSSVLGFPHEAMVQVIDDAEGPVEGKPWEILHILPAASQEEVQKAYHDRMRACHPDRWKTVGVQKLMHQLATRRAASVNAAYKAMSRAGAIKK